MQNLVQHVLALTNGDPADLKQLHSLLQKHNDDVLGKAGAADLDEALVQLDPGLHTLGWIYLLSAKSRVMNDRSIFSQQVAQLLLNAVPGQVRLVPKLFRTLCAKYTDIVADSKEPLKGIEPLRRAIAAVAPSPNHIVPQHWMLAQIAILSKSYNYGVSVFDSDPFHVEPDTTAIDARDVRLFFYYAGICYLGMKKWSSAVEWFKTVIAAPAIVPSAIQVESYRKYVLASLLATGQVESAPRYANPQLLRHLKQLSQPYDELATAYGTNSTDDVHKCAEANHEVFRKDSNFGLVKQVIKSLYRRNIQRLTKTYLTLSLDDIAKQVKLPSTADAERLILQCIENGEIFATISQKDGMVSFQENPEQYNSSRTLQLLDSNLKRTIELLHILQNTEESVSLSHKYLEKVVSADRGSGAGRWPGAGPGDVDDMDVSPLDRPQGAGMRI
eukprot:TRINITY_DN1710_c0_g1_i1.p1 TRINITY_DN1710_c0_g1~~TRINITY_DN1710_c0_g1_i1.p1  ORF type:complete len:444 (-),score=120.33 TRINITY_DN1710_c0_g1_i1:21-1352(-)